MVNKRKNILRPLREGEVKSPLILKIFLRDLYTIENTYKYRTTIPTFISKKKNLLFLTPVPYANIIRINPTNIIYIVFVVLSDILFKISEVASDILVLL
jgi:hypothetical protein